MNTVQLAKINWGTDATKRSEKHMTPTVQSIDISSFTVSFIDTSRQTLRTIDMLSCQRQ